MTYKIRNKFNIHNKRGRKVRALSHFNQRGFGLLEIVIVTAIIIATLAAFAQASILSVRLLRAEKQGLEATLLAQEAMEAIRSIRDESWTNNIAPLVNGTLYYPIVENSKWKLTTISPGLIDGVYSRWVIFDQVLRDSQDRIASSGTVDSGTRKVTSRVTWNNRQIELVAYITNFQTSLGGSVESNVISFEGATTDQNAINFPSNNLGEGDPAQSFTTLGNSLRVSRIDAYLKRITASPSDVYAEIRTSTTGTILGTSQLITASTITSAALSWVEFRFNPPVPLSASTVYYIRLRSIPSSTTAGSGSLGLLHWGHFQTASSPYAGGTAYKFIGSASYPTGFNLDQYDFGFKVYAL